MVQLPRLTGDAVLKSIRECDALTEAEFLARYKFGKQNIRNRIEHQGRTYPAKAVMGRAFFHVDETVVTAADLHGVRALPRLALVGFHPPQGDAVEGTHASTSGGPAVEVVPCEQNVADGFDTPARPAGTAARLEAGLMAGLQAHLRGLGHQVGRVHIAGMYTDTYDVTANVLYEVKAGIERKDVRMAIGQLFDYVRYFDKLPPRLAVVLPGDPGPDLRALVASVGMLLVTPEGDGFSGIPA
ncbi:hypothetical protein GGG17_05180 [Arsenicicoccus sp. MKL-02]|uniref:ScoMcrA-like N-terminal head domain-containing protein n=1 Tax=Arsenicicoccus cauae TaxID=2663847 RepID=A0A6I3IN06_9MICO|nr:hypothetical protein [Arsenicicoccus cauae]MTB71370.1 hypothetical protein [Arsenicicoccus cauae]